MTMIGDRVAVLFAPPSGALILADAGSGGGGTSVNYWAYSAGTLQPDPGTTTPLDLFNVNATDGSAFGQVAAFVTGGLPGAQITSTGTGLNAGVQVGDAINGVLASADDGTGNASLAIGVAGSFSLQADDGTNQGEASFNGGVLKAHTTGTGAELDIVGDDGDSVASILWNVGAGPGSGDLKLRNEASGGDYGTLEMGDTGLTTLESSQNGDVASVALAAYVQLTSVASDINLDAGDGINLNATDDIGLTATNDIIITAGGVIAHAGHIGTDQTAAATVAVGVLAAKLPIYDNANTLVGYIPLYATIT